MTSEGVFVHDRESLVRVAMADPRLAGVLRAGDWYLLGSRAFDAGDELSDWDTVVFTDTDAVVAPPSGVLDEVFGIERPTVDRRPDLGLHVAWRRSQSVELDTLGPTARGEREAALAEWAFELTHAMPLQISTGLGEAYRSQVAQLFDNRRADLAAASYRAFRASRNEAVACLARRDPTAQLLTAAGCVRHAARFWLLAAGHPHPYNKWLLHALRQHPAAAPVVTAIRAILDMGLDPTGRFDALWTLWELIDTHARACATAPELLAGSPFTR